MSIILKYETRGIKGVELAMGMIRDKIKKSVSAMKKNISLARKLETKMNKINRSRRG